jgi:hypothetical protein
MKQTAWRGQVYSTILEEAIVEDKSVIATGGTQ